MSPTAAELFKAAKALSRLERMELVSALWETVEEEGLEQPLSVEWHAEISRRVGAIDAGEVELLTEEEMNRRMQTKYGPLFD